MSHVAPCSLGSPLTFDKIKLGRGLGAVSSGKQITVERLLARANAFWWVKQTMSPLCQLQPAIAVGQKALAMAKRRYSTVTPLMGSLLRCLATFFGYSKIF